MEAVGSANGRLPLLPLEEECIAAMQRHTLGLAAPLEGIAAGPLPPDLPAPLPDPEIRRGLVRLPAILPVADCRILPMTAPGERMATQVPIPADLQAQITRLCEELGCAGPIILVLSFGHRLDADRLARAAALLPEAEPILGCRFVATVHGAAWHRRDDLDQATWHELHEVADPEALIRDLLGPRPEHLEWTFRLHLARHPAGDSLLLWISHLAADGRGAAGGDPCRARH